MDRLRTDSNRIVSIQTGVPVLLRGVNRSGMEYSEPDEDGFASAAGISKYEIRYIAQNWKANFIRITFNQDWALNGRNRFSAEDYLRDLDRIVNWATASGMYTLLCLQWLDADHPFGPDRQFVAPLPNPQTPEVWSRLARRYRDVSSVMFDLFTEPHDRMPDDPYALWQADGTRYPDSQRSVTMAEWQPWASVLVDSIRAESPESLIFVSGVNWAFDLHGYPLDRPNLVYATHVYSNKGPDWDGAFGDLSKSYPVVATEWGGEDGDAQWGGELADYLAARGIGWAAWGWSDKPHLVTPYAPTKFGDVVRQAMGRA